MSFTHQTVLKDEVVRLFSPGVARVIVDGTLGGGGHSEALLEAGFRVVGVDRDPVALAAATERLSRFGDKFRAVKGEFGDVATLVEAPIDGLVLDLGVSSPQLDTPSRGFSFQHDGPLDMRMDPSRDRSAADIVNHWDESDLADLFYYEGGETRARRIAHALVEARVRAPFLRTSALADLVARAVNAPAGGRIHPATRVFQALRRAVNEEGEELLAALSTADHWLCDGGRLAVIAFHSGEDGEVKRFLAGKSREGRFQILTKKPIAAERDEVRANPRARSAHLRVAVRTRAEGDAAVIGGVEGITTQDEREGGIES